MTVGELLVARAELGDRLAYGVGRKELDGVQSPEAPGATLSYAALARVTGRWRSLAGEQLASGHRVVLQIAEPLAFTAAFLGLVAGGATVAPLNPQAPAEERRRLLSLLGGDVFVTDLGEDPEVPTPIWTLRPGGDPPQVAAAVSAVPRRRRLEPKPALILTSSGTTGTPKVIPLDERQLLGVAEKIAEHHRLGPGERGYSPLPLFHVNAEVVGLLSTLVAGSSLVVDRKFRRTAFWDLIDAWRITWINAVPAILAILARSAPPAKETAARVRFARSASAPLPVPVQTEFEQRCGIPVLETYGMTEAAAQITANPVPPAPHKAGSAGRPIGVELRVVDARRRRCPAGRVGQVEIRGPSVIEHYLVPGDEERLRPARVEDGWLQTGDLGHLDNDGYLFLAGRADDVINRGGEKVYPRPIEDVLRSHRLVDDVAVIGEADSILGQCPVAYLTQLDATDTGQLESELRTLAEQRLEPPSRPVAYRVVSSLPAGPTGKVSRRRLRDAVVLGAALA